MKDTPMKDTPPGHLHMMGNDDLFTAKDVKFFQGRVDIAYEIRTYV